MGAQKRKYLHVIIMFVLMIGVGFLPPFGQITPLGMKVLGVFCGLLYGWIFVDLLWPSLLGFIAIAMTGYMDLISAVISGFANAQVLMILLISLFAGALSQIGVTELIAHWVLSKRIFIGKPWLLACVIAATSIVGSILGGGYAVMFLLWGVIIDICKTNGIATKTRLTALLIGAVLFGNIMGAGVIPFLPGVLLFEGFFTNATGLTVPDLPFMVIGVIYIFISVFSLLFFAKVFLKVDANGFNLTEEMCQKHGAYQADRYQKVGMVLLIAFFAGVMLPMIAPNAPGVKVLASLGVLGLSLLYIFVFCVWTKEDGQPVVNMLHCFQYAIPWAVMVLFAVTFPLSAAMESADAGVVATITAAVAPILASLGTTKMLIITIIMVGLLSQVLHNVIVAAVLMPILIPIYINLGGNPYTMFMLMYFSVQCAYATPAASFPAGFLFGHAEVQRKDAYLIGITYMLINFVVLFALIPFCNIFLK